MILNRQCKLILQCKTVADNCQMLCRECNRRKSSK
ncbi:MAG: HNH endonuclease [bacterium]|nr:HNH endonuclease [Candidatus Limimorpha equi]